MIVKEFEKEINVFVDGCFIKFEKNNYSDWVKKNDLFVSEDDKGNKYYKKIKDGFVKMVDIEGEEYFADSRNDCFGLSLIKRRNKNVK